MSTSTEVAVRAGTALVPAHDLLALADASGDLRLMTSARELLAGRAAVTAAFERLRLLQDAKELQRRAEEASQALAVSRAAGSAVADDALRLSGEAEDAWMSAATGWAKALFVPGEVRDRVRERAARPRVAQAPVVMDWDGLDWSRSQGGAA